ncbi:Aste57867_9188 [Aphanomyces stellatus]|uniref:Aste57867_9188 protein n=1 Tax=Aphanomyces stellatus TaxID=120398 RepID=A0A485KMF8_9STRA|nr:hypothetical protein As57867_009152 [Aphanomyces stellatus]VFT86071.1 Aste57867_9188 [Aphanomyces stellatus]
MAAHMESLHLPRLDLGIFKNSSRYLERVGKPTIPFQAPAWATPQKPSAIALVDVFKANEVVTSVNVDSKACFLFGRNALVCDIVLEHCSISRMHAALVHHHDGAVYLIDLGSCHGTFMDGEKLEALQPTLITHGAQLRFGVSSRTYRFKSYESRQQIEQRVQVAVGLQDDERELQMNTLLNRFLSYRLDGPLAAAPPTNPWPQNSNRIASNSTDTNEDASAMEEEDAPMTNDDCGGMNIIMEDPTMTHPPSRKRTRPASSLVETDQVFITYETKRVQFVDAPQVIPPSQAVLNVLRSEEDNDDMDVDSKDDTCTSDPTTAVVFPPSGRPFYADAATNNGAATPQTHYVDFFMLGSETTRCGAPAVPMGFPMCDGRPSLSATRIDGRRHTLG